MVIRKGLCEWIAFGLRKRAAFLAQARQHKNEKPFITPLRQYFSTAPKLTEVSKFHPQNPTVSLQKDDSFSKLRSLASAHKVTLSHRFKSSPAIPGNLAVFATTGYMMMAGHFSKSHVSSGDLNRGSQDGVVSLKHGRLAHVRSQFSLFRRSPTHKNLPLATFCTSERAFWFFLHDAKRIKSFPYGKLRGFANLESAHPNNKFAPTT